MLTFTLPAGLRPLALAQPKAIYSALFHAASETIKGFGQRKLKAELRTGPASGGDIDSARGQVHVRAGKGR